MTTDARRHDSWIRVGNWEDSHDGQTGYKRSQADPNRDAELARELGLYWPWGHGPKAGYGPGVTEYGRGLTLTAVHGGTCCERWDTARVARLAGREAGS